MAEPERVGDIIAGRRAAGSLKKKLRLELLRNNWPSLAGERLAGHSSPTRLSRGTLTVAADGASWAGELSAVSFELQKNIEKLLGGGTVRKVRVLARALSKGPAPAGDEDGDVTEEVNVEGKLGEALGGLGDLEVREALGRMVRASRASEQSRRSRD